MWVIVDEKTGKHRAQYVFHPGDIRGKRSNVGKGQQASIQLSQLLENSLWELRYHPTWDTASGDQRADLLCTLVHRVADGRIPSFLHRAGEDVALTVGDPELERLRKQADLPALEVTATGHEDVGNHGGNGGASDDNNNTGNSAPNNHGGSGDQENGKVSQVHDDHDATMSEVKQELC